MPPSPTATRSSSISPRPARASSRPSRARSPPTRPECTDQGYSDCARHEYSGGEGTSFAAPQVSAAAALLLATDPRSRPDQVATLLERSADDMTPSNGCRACAIGRDPLTRLGPARRRRRPRRRSRRRCRRPDVREPNDGAGRACRHGLGQHGDDRRDDATGGTTGSTSTGSTSEGAADRRVGARPVRARREPRPLAARHRGRRRHLEARARDARGAVAGPARQRSPSAPR